MPQHYLATTSENSAFPLASLPSSSRSFSQRPAGAIPIARRTGCSSGITRPEEFSQAWARRGNGVRLIELVVRDFPASGVGLDDALFDIIRRRDERAMWDGGKKREARWASTWWSQFRGKLLIEDDARRIYSRLDDFETVIRGPSPGHLPVDRPECFQMRLVVRCRWENR